jgi:hypothetical protein
MNVGGDFMQKAHLYEAISLSNHGMDEAVRGLERLKKAPGVAEGTYRATLATLEHTRAQVNLRFLADMEQAEKRDAVRYEQRENS